MKSVDSSNPIRDNRLIDMFFQAEFFPATIVRANLDAEILNSKEPVQNISLEAWNCSFTIPHLKAQNRQGWS
jgi:hypothetical protein